MLPVAFQSLVSDQRVRQCPAKASLTSSSLLFAVMIFAVDGQLQLVPSDLHETLANDVDEHVENGMPLVLLHVEVADVGGVRGIVEFEAASVRRVVESGEEDERANERFADARHTREKAEKAIEEETEIGQRVVEPKVAQAEEVSIVDEEDHAEKANEEELKEDEDDHGQEKLGEQLQQDQRVEQITR